MRHTAVFSQTLLETSVFIQFHTVCICLFWEHLKFINSSTVMGCEKPGSLRIVGCESAKEMLDLVGQSTGGEYLLFICGIGAGRLYFLSVPLAKTDVSPVYMPHLMVPI